MLCKNSSSLDTNAFTLIFSCGVSLPEYKGAMKRRRLWVFLYYKNINSFCLIFRYAFREKRGGMPSAGNVLCALLIETTFERL